jgi:hypothetical protein
VFVSFALLLAVICLGIVSEEMLIASPTALSFWIVVSVVVRQSEGPAARLATSVARPAEAGR